ncbi:hypothetical protein ACP70R_045585 [Stipagrostis hirtigluma subsp. patula]
MNQMISAVCWIPKGAAKNAPPVAEPPTQEERDEATKIKSISFDRNCYGCDYDDGDNGMDIADGAHEQDGALQAKGVANALSREKPDDPSDNLAAALLELNMESYDDEEDGPNTLGTGSGELYYPTNDMDPHLKKTSVTDYDEDDEEDEDLDRTVKPTDLMIVSAHKDGLYNSLEDKLVNIILVVVILEELEDGDLNMYPYHEIPLCHFPLCLSWSNCGLKDGQKGNFVAVGTMGPEIEIWDLNMVDWFEPHIVLGGKLKKEKGKREKMVAYVKGSHKDSILGTAWNMEYMNILASASADQTVKIWDVAVGKCVTTFEHHDSKVQAVAWNQHSPEIILSGSFDKSIALKDVKNCAQGCLRWLLEADVEAVAWDPHSEHCFVVSLENGMVQAFDKRKASSSQNSSLSMFTLHAHEKAVSSISFGSSAPNFLATASTDETVRICETLGPIKQPTIMDCFHEPESGTFSRKIDVYPLGNIEFA